MIETGFHARTGVAVIALRIRAAVPRKTGAITKNLTGRAGGVRAYICGNIADLAACAIIRIIA